ncbi:MAG: hypothetical protein IKN64_04220 [Desulfovibrio sp.]|nr:hypothetical protein [Desulfovibrio sp.]
MKKQHFPIAETLRFGRALGENNDINVHFEIYCLDMQSPPQERGLMIYESFSDHGRKGGDYLLTRLSDDDNIASLAAYLLASWRASVPASSRRRKIPVSLGHYHAFPSPMTPRFDAEV